MRQGAGRPARSPDPLVRARGYRASRRSAYRRPTVRADHDVRRSVSGLSTLRHRLMPAANVRLGAKHPPGSVSTPSLGPQIGSGAELRTGGRANVGSARADVAIPRSRRRATCGSRPVRGSPPSIPTRSSAAGPRHSRMTFRGCPSSGLCRRTSAWTCQARARRAHVAVLTGRRPRHRRRTLSAGTACSRTGGARAKS